MIKFTLPLLFISSFLVIGCGGGGSKTNSSGTGTGTGTGAGAGAGNPGTGGSGIIPQNVVQNLYCENLTLSGGKTISIKGGSEGSISVSCDPTVDEFPYRLGSIPSLNITDAKIIRTTVQKCDSGETKLISDIELKALSDGEIKSYISNTETGEIVSCKSSFTSPLPTTISTDESIYNLINYLITSPVTMISSDCPTTLPSKNLTGTNCELSTTVNSILYVGQIAHKTTYLHELK